ncbi:MAG: exodeoxyribonuclease VII large subunit [Holosporales bacterium]|jgi:exodeoxyribonuclease VII large subunit|nr:exodeoxyribonuclease VII large subunit [Holosporales bacterium]
MLDNTARSYLLHTSDEEKILTVSELSFAIKGTIERDYSSIKLQGEISGLKKHSSGHTYLCLKDNESVINAICWRGTKVSFPLEDGMEIIVRGRVTTYPSRSQYQFIIEEASMSGEGALLKLINERRKRFAALGYFDNKREIPKFPRIIGIVTSQTGAVLQDMRHRLEDRYPFCDVVVWPVNVQGTMAPEQISNAIRGFNFMIDRRPDVLVVARGGGSIEDLMPFNEELVVKAVYDSSIPVVSAIGHETDTTLIDYASDLRAPTPTAAIELITPVLADIKLRLMDLRTKMKSLLIGTLKEMKTRITNAIKHLISSQFIFLAIRQSFDDKIGKFLILINNYFQKESMKLDSKKIMGLNYYLNLKQQQYSAVRKTLEKRAEYFMVQHCQTLKVLGDRLEQASFKKILSKGFCFITDMKGSTIETKLDFEASRNTGYVIHFQDGMSEILYHTHAIPCPTHEKFS